MSVWTFKREDMGAERTGRRLAPLLTEPKETGCLTHPSSSIIGDFLFLIIYSYLMFIDVLIRMYVCVRVSEALKLELQTGMSCYVGAWR